MPRPPPPSSLEQHACITPLHRIPQAPAPAERPGRAEQVVHYRWRGSKIAADGAPPLIFGRRGSKLHLAS